MFDVSRISKNLIAVSLISSILVVWLGCRYLSDAHKQFSGATQLERSVIAEDTLFKISNSLDKERATTNRMLLSADQYSNETQKLRDLAEKTKTLFEQAHQEISQSHNAESERIQHRHSQESVELLLDNLEDKFRAVSVSRFVISSQTNRAPEERDENVRMQIFDVYVEFIEAANRLRKETYTYPEKNYIEVLNAHDSRDAIWTINESINQTNTLISSLLMKRQMSGIDTLHAENLALRILQQHERTTTALQFLEKMVNNGAIAGDTSTALSALNEQYSQIFRPKAMHLLLSVPSDIDASEELIKWQQVSESTKQSAQTLRAAILFNTVTTAKIIKSVATRNLAFNACLVFLCMVMAYATFRIARGIQHQANHDDLTGLANRRLFNQTLESLYKQTDTSKNEKLIMLTLDLNGFKSINDSMGHLGGDALLVQVAERLAAEVKCEMSIARMGGDEFATSFITNDDKHPYKVACRLQSTFDQPFAVNEGFVNIDASVGYSSYPEDASTIQQLQMTSDFAMFSAKQVGKEGIQPYDHEMAAKFENRIAIEKDLQIAIENNDFELYYQPQLNFKSNTANAVEALLRWNHPTHGMVPPDKFICVAEETGLMPVIGKWVLDEACRQVAEWKNTANMDIQVAVNVSVHQLVQTDFVQAVFDTIEHHGILASNLELEITESVIVTDINWVIESLNAFKERGIKIALDDFGTGYSSLSQLQELPLDTLKIDRSFIDKLDSGANNMHSITATIASIAQIFNLETVAEGIETENQLIEAKKLGIDIAQGYYYSKPVPQDEVVETINTINNWVDGQSKAA